MDIKILIATPNRSFGERISQALQEAGYYPLLVPGIADELGPVLRARRQALGLSKKELAQRARKVVR